MEAVYLCFKEGVFYFETSGWCIIWLNYYYDYIISGFNIYFLFFFIIALLYIGINYVLLSHGIMITSSFILSFSYLSPITLGLYSLHLFVKQSIFYNYKLLLNFLCKFLLLLLLKWNTLIVELVVWNIESFCFKYCISKWLRMFNDFFVLLATSLVF